MNILVPAAGRESMRILPSSRLTRSTMLDRPIRFSFKDPARRDYTKVVMERIPFVTFVNQPEEGRAE